MPRIVDHKQRKQDIVDHCFHLFAEQGYAAVSMRNIATSLGVSTGVLYHYFENKKAIFEAVFRHRSATDVAIATQNITDASSQLERLSALREFVSHHREQLLKTLQIGLEYRRQSTTTESDFLHTTLEFYRATIGEQLGITEPEMTRVAVSILLGMLVQDALDGKDGDLAAHVDCIQRLTPAAKIN